LTPLLVIVRLTAQRRTSVHQLEMGKMVKPSPAPTP